MPLPITPQIKTVMDQIISCFENSTPVIQYNSVVDLNDGRGYTCGKAGFTTADGDALGVVTQYNHGPIMQVVPILQTLQQQNSDDVKALDADGFSQLWENACNDPAFTRAQDYICDTEYFTPAYNLATRYKCDSNLGVLCFYDTAVEHGADGGPDSLQDIIKRTLNGGQDLDLTAFLVTRKAVLENPQDPTTTEAWRESIDRVNVLLQFITDENWDLKTPITFTVFGDGYTIPAATA